MPRAPALRVPRGAHCVRGLRFVGSFKIQKRESFSFVLLWDLFGYLEVPQDSTQVVGDIFLFCRAHWEFGRDHTTP